MRLFNNQSKQSPISIIDDDECDTNRKVLFHSTIILSLANESHGHIFFFYSLSHQIIGVTWLRHSVWMDLPKFSVSYIGVPILTNNGNGNGNGNANANSK